MIFSRKAKPPKESAKQLTVYQQRSFSYPAPPPGALPYSAYDAMERDSMVQTALTVKRLGVMAAKYSITGETSRVRFVEEAFARMEGSPATIVMQALDALSKGWSVQEMVYEYAPPPSPPLREGTAGPKVWLKAVRPKDPSLFGLEVDPYGKVTGLKLQIPGEAPQNLPREKFVVYQNRGGYGRPKGKSDLDAAYPHWSAKQTLLAAWSLHLERFAMPTVLGRFQSGLSVDDQAALIAALKDLQHNTSLVFPNEIEIDTLSVSKEQSTGFMDSLDFHNREIARAILGQTLTTDEGRRVGSLAMGKVHLQVLLLQLQALRDELADSVMTEQVIRPLVEMNFGPGEVPRFEFESAPLDVFSTGRVP